MGTIKKYLTNDVQEVISTFFLTVLLLIAFIIIWSLQEHISKSQVIFYSGLHLEIIFGIFSFFVFYIIKKYVKIFTYKIYFYAIIYFFILSFTFNITFPTNIDRSLSVYIMAKVYNTGSISINELSNIIKSKMSEPSQASRRIHEQVALGNFIVMNDTISLTERGIKFYKFHYIIGKVFNLDASTYSPKVPGNARQ